MEKTLHNKIYLSIASSIKDSIKSGFDLDVELADVYGLFSTPRMTNLGKSPFLVLAFQKLFAWAIHK